MTSWMTQYAYCHAGGRPGNEPHGWVVAELDLDRRGCRSGVGDMDEGVERYVRTGRIVGGLPCVCVCATGPVQDHANALVLFRRTSSMNQILAPCSPHLFIEFQNSSYIVPRAIHLELILRIIYVSLCCTTPSQATPFTLKFTL